MMKRTSFRQGSALLIVLGLFQKDGEKDAERDRGAA